MARGKTVRLNQTKFSNRFWIGRRGDTGQGTLSMVQLRSPNNHWKITFRSIHPLTPLYPIRMRFVKATVPSKLQRISRMRDRPHRTKKKEEKKKEKWHVQPQDFRSINSALNVLCSKGSSSLYRETQGGEKKVSAREYIPATTLATLSCGPLFSTPGHRVRHLQQSPFYSANEIHCS